jgi:hydrogenase maturation protease
MRVMRRVAVLGLGNVLMGDDAAGPAVVRLLQAGWRFPPNVAVEDLGTPGLDLSPYLLDLDLAVIVDTVMAPGLPGEVRVYTYEQILARPAGPRISPHDPGLKETLTTAALAGRAPRELVLVGIVPQRVHARPGLTASVRAGLPDAAAEVLWQLAVRGIDVPLEPTASRIEFWWESPPSPRAVRA